METQTISNESAPLPLLDPHQARKLQRATSLAKKTQAQQDQARKDQTLRARSEKISGLIAKTQADTVKLTSGIMGILKAQQELTKEVEGLIRFLNASPLPEDKEAAQAMARLKMSCATNLRMVSGILGASKQMHNLKNFQLIIE